MVPIKWIFLDLKESTYKQLKSKNYNWCYKRDLIESYTVKIKEDGSPQSGNIMVNSYLIHLDPTSNKMFIVTNLYNNTLYCRYNRFKSWLRFYYFAFIGNSEIILISLAKGWWWRFHAWWLIQIVDLSHHLLLVIVIVIAFGEFWATIFFIVFI